MQYFHFVGIGGYGMSGLARVLAGMGYRVTGSDLKESERTRRLADLGLDIAIGHRTENLGHPDAVVFSTDVPPDNVELRAAAQQGIPVLHRSEVLAKLLNSRFGIAVTGTHGKTTTSAMIALLLEKGGLDPTVVLGGEVDDFEGNAKLGHSEFLVAEACESDGSFRRYTPRVSVVTNIEKEHLDHYSGDFNAVVEAFRCFIFRTKPEGAVIVCADDPLLPDLAAGFPRGITYGLHGGAEIAARNLRHNGRGYDFELWRRGVPLGELRLKVPGRHNVSNALAAMAVGLEVGLEVPLMEQVLAGFAGAKRRYQVLASSRSGPTVVDDYAHHPTEIKATLRAARERAQQRVIAVFQPQRYVRTHLLMQEFSQAFGDADEIILAEIYSPPGENPIPGVSSQVLADLIRRQGGTVSFFPEKAEIVDYLLENAAAGDTVVTMGAGDIWTVAHDLAGKLAGGGEKAS